MFYAGQKVVSLKTVSNGFGQSITEGTIYLVDGIHECTCGQVMLDVGIKSISDKAEGRCTCGRVTRKPICWANARLFAPLNDWQLADELVAGLIEPLTLQEA